ncbi:MAG: hypothetical protein AAF206_13070 [Bacteroidota bacterium]
MITFYHTSASHINRFNQLLEKLEIEVEIVHHVNESILTEALTKGVDDPNVRQQFSDDIRALLSTNTDMIICTCSTFGPQCEGLQKSERPVHRIDQPMASWLVQNLTAIVLAFTAASTRESSLGLLRHEADVAGKHPQISELDCTDCWPLFGQGELRAYEQAIARKIMQANLATTHIFLAQASMQGAVDWLPPACFHIYTSTEFGLKHILADLIAD